MIIKRVPDDPVVLARVLLRVFKHLDERQMPLIKIRILMSILMMAKWNPAGSSIKEIAKETGLTKDQIHIELLGLVETRHIHEVVPLFGDKFLYKLGPVGQTFANAVRRQFEAREEENIKEA